MDSSEHREPASSGTDSAGPSFERDIEAVLDAAIDAELATGRREPDRETARAHLLVRLARGGAGILLAGVGVALTVLPGPGVLLILAGLGILAIDYPFAARLRDRLLTTGGHLAGRAGRILRRVLVGAALVILVSGALLVMVLLLLVRAVD